MITAVSPGVIDFDYITVFFTVIIPDRINRVPQVIKPPPLPPSMFIIPGWGILFVFFKVFWGGGAELYYPRGCEYKVSPPGPSWKLVFWTPKWVPARSDPKMLKLAFWDPAWGYVYYPPAQTLEIVKI